MWPIKTIAHALSHLNCLGHALSKADNSTWLSAKILRRLARKSHRSMLLSWRETAFPWCVPSPTFPAINSSEGTTTLIVCYEMVALICKNGSHILLKYLGVIQGFSRSTFANKFITAQKCIICRRMLFLKMNYFAAQKC